MLPLQPPSFADTAAGVRPSARDGRREPREAFDPKWVTGAVEEDKSASGESSEDEEDLDDPTGSMALAPVDAPIEPPRLPREAAEGAPYPSGSADRAPSPPAADPLFGSVSSIAVHVEAADIDVLPPIGQAVLDGEALGGTFSAAPTDGAEGSWMPLVPDRQEPDDAQRFTPLGSAGGAFATARPAQERPQAAAPQVAPAPAPGAPSPGETVASARPEPVLEPLEKELARLVFAATAVRAGPPAHGGRLRSTAPAPSAPTAPSAEAAPEGPSTAAPTATATAATTPDGPSPGQAPDVGAAPAPEANATRATLPRESAPPAGPPQREEPLPPPSSLPHTRLRIDRELSVEVSSHGRQVDVALHGTPDALEPLRDIGPELGESLASNGFSLGQFLTQDQEPEQDGAPSHGGEPAPTGAPRPARQDGSRIRRYA